ncbi:MAG: competence/damage-inducible protein A [Myxococcales bacterium]|nr:competence/damage-inducible protein A [Myxococcales bacterium]
MRTAAIVLIGNELLSGKIQDENAAWLARRLRTLGVDLRRISVVPDDPAAITDEVRRVHRAVDHVFTSGGVGPTHDDITLETIATAFDVPLVRDAELAALIAHYFGDRLQPDHLRMADVPEGCELIRTERMPWPVYNFREIYILPGVPKIFRAKFEAIAERFACGTIHLRNLYLNADEGSIAALLRQAQAEHDVMIGSYPRFDEADFRVRITVESRTPDAVDAAVVVLLAGLSPTAVVRVDAPISDRS